MCTANHKKQNQASQNISYETLCEESHDPEHPCYERWKQYELSGIQRGHRIFELMNKRVLLERKLVLDVGSGDGGISISFARHNCFVTSLEPDFGRLKRTKVRTNEHNTKLNLVAAFSENLPFVDEKFDLLIMNDVIEHVQNIPQTIKEISRVLRTGGLCYLSVPNKLSIHNVIDEPHYGLFGITILPRQLASFYVTKIRKRGKTYEVGRFPTLSSILERFSQANISMKLHSHQHIGKQLEKINYPDQINSSVMRCVIKILNLLKLNFVIKAVIFLKLNLWSRGFVFIGKKEDGTIERPSLKNLFYTTGN